MTNEQRRERIGRIFDMLTDEGISGIVKYDMPCAACMFNSFCNIPAHEPSTCRDVIEAYLSGEIDEPTK